MKKRPGNYVLEPWNNEKNARPQNLGPYKARHAWQSTTSEYKTLENRTLIQEGQKSDNNL